MATSNKKKSAKPVEPAESSPATSVDHAAAVASTPPVIATPDGSTLPADSTSMEDRIREAAYRRFEARGYTDGQHEDDWLEAEREVRPPMGN